MRYYAHSLAALLPAAAALLLPTALRAQTITHWGGQASAPGQAAPAPAPLAPGLTPRQVMPFRGGPTFMPSGQGVQMQYGQMQNGYGYSRGPVYSSPAYPTPGNYPTLPSGGAFPSRTYQYSNGNDNRSYQYGNGNSSIRFYGGRGYGDGRRHDGDGGRTNNSPVLIHQGGYLPSRPVQVNTPGGSASLPPGGSYPIYGGGPGYNYTNDGYGTGITVVGGGPALLGGYYYSNYCDTFNAGALPSVYSAYSGFPTYIYAPASVVVLSDPYAPAYVTGYQTFDTPSYPVVYNQNIYYVGSRERAEQITDGDEAARKAALSTAAPEGSYQAAFGDIERAWLDGNVAGLQKHLRAGEVKLSVFFKGKYSYSIATDDYVQITRDAFDKIRTVSFKFDRLRKAKNGDVTAFGKHVYRTVGDSADGTVPFSTDPADAAAVNAASAPGEDKTINVAYTLRHQNGQWSIVTVDSSPAAP